MVKQLAVVLTLSALMTACGGSSDKKKSTSSSSSSVSVVSSASSVVVSSASSSVVASSSSSSAVSSSSSSEVVVVSSSSSSSSVASSSSSSETSSSSSSGGIACVQNPDSVIPCDASKWVVDGGNGGSIEQGEYGPIFINGAPTGTESYNKPGMFFVLDNPGAVIGKTLTFIVVIDKALKDTGAAIQPVIQENGGSYGGFWSCQTNNEDFIVDGETTVSCTHSGTSPANNIAALRLGFQLNASKSYEGTIEIVDATWE